ncbi:MAG TPA: helix-turn-helix domain-containing protein [Mycobacterium sp.]|jgi:DNA-binding transcriptional regulator YiaG
MTPAQIKAFRLERELTQADAGKLLGVDMRTWRRWERPGAEVPPFAGLLIRLIQNHPHVLNWPEFN